MAPPFLAELSGPRRPGCSGFSRRCWESDWSSAPQPEARLVGAVHGPCQRHVAVKPQRLVQIPRDGLKEFRVRGHAVFAPGLVQLAIPIVGDTHVANTLAEQAT